MIRETCEQHAIDLELLKDLCELMNDYSGSGRRFGLPDEIDGIINRFFSRTSEA